MINVTGLHKQYGELEVLKDIDLSINKGEVIALIGPSGSVKSTLIRCLKLIELPTQGRIEFKVELINESKLDEVKVDKIRQNVGMVCQHFNLFPHLTVMENITLAPVKLNKMTSSQAVAKSEELKKSGIV